MNNRQLELLKQINLLKTKKQATALIENLKQKIKDGVIYTDLTESEVKEVFNNNSKNQQLNESVTFIDNAGNLKTMTVENYNKDMHEYHTKTQIEKFDKKNLKNRDYELLDEDVNTMLESFKSHAKNINNDYKYYNYVNGKVNSMEASRKKDFSPAERDKKMDEVSEKFRKRIRDKEKFSDINKEKEELAKKRRREKEIEKYWKERQEKAKEANKKYLEQNPDAIKKIKEANEKNNEARNKMK